jgi:hypothetical protein
MTKKAFTEMILSIIENGKLPARGEHWHYNFYNMCKAFRDGKPYKWHKRYDEVLDELSVDRNIFEKRIKMRWLNVLAWVQEHGRRPLYSNSAQSDIEYKYGNLLARVSRSKWGRTGVKWDVWYEEQIYEHGLSEIIIL